MTDTRRRVKLYELNAERQWDDKGMAMKWQCTGKEVPMGWQGVSGEMASRWHRGGQEMETRWQERAMPMGWYGKHIFFWQINRGEPNL